MALLKAFMGSMFKFLLSNSKSFPLTAINLKCIKNITFQKDGEVIYYQGELGTSTHSLKLKHNKIKFAESSQPCFLRSGFYLEIGKTAK